MTNLIPLIKSLTDKGLSVTFCHQKPNTTGCEYILTHFV